MADDFTLDRLEALCEAGDWEAAEEEARSIAFICRRNWLILNPPVTVKRPLPYQRSPSDRIYAFILRLSRRRIIERKEAYALAVRLARVWSGNSGNTLRAFSFLWSAWSDGGRFWRGEWRRDRIEPYEELTKLARENGWQWVDLRRHAADMKRKKLNEIGREQVALSETREVLKDLNRVIRERQAA